MCLNQKILSDCSDEQQFIKYHYIKPYSLNAVFKDELRVVTKIISGITPSLHRPDDILPKNCLI